MNEGRQVSDRSRSVSEEDLEGYSRVLDVVSFRDDPGDESNETDDERSEDPDVGPGIRVPSVSQTRREQSDGDNEDDVPEEVELLSLLAERSRRRRQLDVESSDDSDDDREREIPVSQFVSTR